MFVWTRSVSVRAWAVTAVTLGATTFSVATLLAAPPPPTLFPPAVAGPQVTLSWSAVPGALGYRLSLGASPGADHFSHIVGPVTSITFTVPFTGTGYVRIQAGDATGLGAPSNEVTLTVTSMTPVPAAPVGLQAFVSGRNVTFTWGPGAGGGPPQAVVFQAGTAPGLGNLGHVVLPLMTSGTISDVPNGTYYTRVYAANTSGLSAPSNEVRVDVGGSGGCSPPSASGLSVATSGSQVSFNWNAAPGAAGYRLEVATGPAGPVGFAQIFGASTTSFVYPSAPAGTYYARIVSLSACGLETGSGVSPFTVAQAPGTGRRTPNPPPGGRLPLPNMSHVVEAIAARYPHELRNSCVEHGGNNAWLFLLVQELRRHDTRWGLNWKRARVGDMSQDVVNYNYSSDPDEGTYNTYVVDVIGGHCGSNPAPAWIDQTIVGSTGARWTLVPYLQAGGQP